MHRNWLVNRTNPEFLHYISNQASISATLAQILVNRGIKDTDSIKKFLYPSIEDLHDPFLLPDMDRAVERIKTASEKGETLFIHGDYDADGLTSTAILVSTFRKLGMKTFYHIPNRITEGYGLSNQGIQKARDCGSDLIITADCGISSYEAVLTSRSMGMDIIVTDHHEPPDILPEATAVIDPHRTDSVYPFKPLAGVGVVFKLIQAISRELRGTSYELRIEKFLDLVALGTIADSVPLTGENRIIACYGLRKINEDKCRTGIRALKEAAGIDKTLSSGLLSYTLIPRINASGRLDDAGQVVELFMTEDNEKAITIAKLLEEQNRERQKIESRVLNSALEMIDTHNIDNAIVLGSPDWHPGVVGIVASRLVDMFFRPVFLFSIKDSVAKGSARSIPALNIYKAISECSDFLLGFGGHSKAAGLRISSKQLSEFRKNMNLVVGRNISATDMIPILEIDATIKFSDINFNLVRELSLLEPFGDSNREPVFGAKDIKIINQRIVGEKHLKMQLKQDRIDVDTIGFGMGEQLQKIDGTSSLDIVFVPCINKWNGMRNLQLNLKAIRPSS